MRGGGGCSIVWFRRDLRVEDNPALAAGVRAGAVVAVFIWAPEEEGQYYPGRVSRWWLKQSLVHLDSSLRNLGTRLVTKRSTDTVSSLLEVVKSTGATQLFFNHLYGQFPFPSIIFFCNQNECPDSGNFVTHFGLQEPRLHQLGLILYPIAMYGTGHHRFFE